MKINPKFHLSGTAALLMDVAHGSFELGTQQKLWALCGEDGALRRLPGVASVLLGVNNVAVTFDPLGVRFEALRDAMAQAWAESTPFLGQGRLVEVPVDYEATVDSDLEAVAANAELSIEETIALHASADYRVACIGWVPGFAFLVGLPPQLTTPRRANPRLRVPKGSVGIGGAQTGVIPIDVPSGWNLLGRTTIELFSPGRANPCLLAPGDRVRFIANSTAP
ncbi:5-oxoprolinase subunit PxpB [Ramlibacter sp. WS9]|uniref:5-oxoprolinase subunit PxpB n=1 Tax=Ramlibacter sp. WS9 TaxID=1882741 RepID=UPI0011416458|nr:5-oxoprolinase subunit PxpB [Ramlibacter sp. WS9]ROZ78036.1 5-oxoprolinase subunit PxpB [Ramlibacter sp. WS9]